MVKKVKKKKTSKKAAPRRRTVTKPTASTTKVDKAIIQNFVTLQKVMTNLSLKLDSLTTQMSKLLELFEISAKSLAEKEFDLGEGKDYKKIESKLDDLIDQNKLIAKGVTLMHEGNLGKELPRAPPSKPLHPRPMSQQRASQMTGYAKGITHQRESPK